MIAVQDRQDQLLYLQAGGNLTKLRRPATHPRSLLWKWGTPDAARRLGGTAERQPQFDDGKTHGPS